MPQILRTFAVAFVAISILSQPSGAQTNKLSLDGGGARGLTGLITTGKVTLTWPVMRGNWELMEQQPAFKAEWVPVPAGNYRTNSFGVSVTLPLPEKTSLYRLKPAGSTHPAAMPPMPPMPPASTNHPRPLKPAEQP